jgi:tetratricopeptide (TPR) repeat protein
MLAEPHTSLGHAYFHEFNWPAAEREFKLGLELNPNYAVGHFYFANYLLARGRFRDALAEARHAKLLDPVSLPARSNTATALYYCGQYERAIEECLQVVEIDASFARTYDDLGRIYREREWEILQPPPLDQRQRSGGGKHAGLQLPLGVVRYSAVLMRARIHAFLEPIIEAATICP